MRESGGVVRVRLSGRWALGSGLPPTDAVAQEIKGGPPVARLVFEPAGLEEWDSTLVGFVFGAASLAAGAEVDVSALPAGARRLLDLAMAVPPVIAGQPPEDDAITARVGQVSLHAWRTAGDAVGFIGETVLALWAMLRGKARFQARDLMHAFETAGVGALGIVALINLLIGAVLAFVGAVQLQQFGATVYVADLVAIGITRELGALMTGIVMAGRTGASFAAVLGTMTVNEEVDALKTMGLRPTEFLVLPRVVATSLMLPALVAYADFFGILGGTFAGVALLDLGALQYLRATRESLAVGHVVVGLVKGVAFGMVVSLTGCYYGIRCGRSAAAVGEATTKAVVMGIVLVVVVDAAFTVLLHLLDL